MKSVTAIGPASSANLGSGFDCFAIARTPLMIVKKKSIYPKKLFSNNLILDNPGDGPQIEK